MKTLNDYIKELQTEDLIEAAHTAKVQSHTLLEDQGISTLALGITETAGPSVSNCATANEK